MAIEDSELDHNFDFAGNARRAAATDQSREAFEAAETGGTMGSERTVLDTLIEARRVLGTGVGNFEKWLKKRIEVESRGKP